ncbi:hypothetical protein [Marivita hallyeonensis]|nr:hypothetical protein [Marivita hallyeonensis]
MSVPKAPFPVLRGVLRDLANRLAEGQNAPHAQERIWINPSRITRIYTRNPLETPDFKRRHSGMIVAGDWDQRTEPIDQSWKIAACLAHFRDGVPWEQTGVFERMQDVIARRGTFDGCRTQQDIEARYRRIDALYANIKASGYRNETVIRRAVPRLPEGVFVHIDRDGTPVFGAIGNHRMGIARALGLTRIPAQLGVVHPKALSQGALQGFRDPRP